MRERTYLYRPQRSWGKVIFSQASVILLMGGCLLWRGSAPKEGVWSQGGVVLGGAGPGGVWSWGGLVRGVSAPGGAWWIPPGTATAAGGTHPIGMHSFHCRNKFNICSAEQIFVTKFVKKNIQI